MIGFFFKRGFDVKQKYALQYVDKKDTELTDNFTNVRMETEVDNGYSFVLVWKLYKRTEK